MAGQPNIARNWDFFQFEAGARLYAGDKAADVNWMDNFHFNFHPLKVIPFDPQFAAHTGQYASLGVRWPVALSGLRVQQINVATVQLVGASARQRKRERLGQLRDEFALAFSIRFVFGDAPALLRLALGAAFGGGFLEFLLLFGLLVGVQGLVIEGDQLLVLRAVEHDVFVGSDPIFVLNPLRAVKSRLGSPVSFEHFDGAFDDFVCIVLLHGFI